MERPSGSWGRCGRGCHGDHRGGEWFPWGGKRLAAAPLSHRMTCATVLLILHLRCSFSSVCGQAIFGTATRVSGRHFLKISIGETSSAIIQSLLGGCRQRRDDPPWAAAVVCLEEENKKGWNDNDEKVMMGKKGRKTTVRSTGTQRKLSKQRLERKGGQDCLSDTEGEQQNKSSQPGTHAVIFN